MTTQHEPRDEFDCEEIERELNEIPSWPWRVGTRIMYGTNGNYLLTTAGGVKEQQTALFFASKSPQRLAAAVKRIRELEEVIRIGEDLCVQLHEQNKILPGEYDSFLEAIEKLKSSEQLQKQR